MSENFLDTKAILGGLKNVEEAIGRVTELIKEMTKESKKSFKDLGKSMSDTFKEGGKESEKALKKIEKATETVAEKAIENANDIEKNWTNAFSRMSVLSETIKGAGKFFGELTQGPRQMETAMAGLSFVSKEVKNNYDSVRDSLLAMGVIALVYFLSLSLSLQNVTKYFSSIVNSLASPCPVKRFTITPINVNNKQPKRNRTITKTKADKASYLIQLITNTISSTRYEKNFTYFIIDSTINLISYFKITKRFDFVNLKMRVVCQ